MSKIQAWLAIHPKVAVGGIALVWLYFVAPWASTHGLDVGNVNEALKPWLGLLASYLTPSTGSAQ